MRTIVSSFAEVIHTPFVAGKGDSPVILCAAGTDSRHMDLWLVASTAPPVKILEVTPNVSSSMCGPWVVPEGDGIALYCSVAYYKHNEDFRISKFTAPSLHGPYTLVVNDVVGTRLPTHSPCFVDDYMYFVHGANTLSRRLVQGGAIETVMEFSRYSGVSELFKPNIYRTGPNQLCMFLTEVINEVDYTVGIYVSSTGLDWQRVGTLSPGIGLYSYKPTLYKGNLIRVGRDTVRFTEMEATWFEVEHIKLSEISPVFTDYPYDYYFPEFII